MQIHSFARGCLAASVCWLVAAVPAQSALETKPASPVRTRAVTPSAPATGDEARLRLAEVMAMLEEDQLTPEQRRRALAKLAEVQAQLRAQPPEPPPPPASAAPAKTPGAGMLFAVPRKSQAPTASYREQPATSMLAERVQPLQPAAGNPESLSRSKDAESGRRTVVQGKEGAKIFYVMDESAEVDGRLQQAKELRAQAQRLEQQAAMAKETLQRNRARISEQTERAREQAARSREEWLRSLEKQARKVEFRGFAARGGATEAVEVPAGAQRTPAASKPLPAESAEVQAILEQMRAEMREIRAVIEDLRGQLPPSEAEATSVRRPARAGR
jgi:hypothetical protein